MEIKIEPATPDRWSDLETLFGPRGACGGCWCMYWRLPRAQFDFQKGEANRWALKGLVESGQEPGLIAYVEQEPAGWVALAPRENYPTLERSRVLKRVDPTPVWSVVCFYVKASFRRKGLTVQMLEAAKLFVKDRGGTILEGYPILPKGEKTPPVFAYTGLLSAFLQAGFIEVARFSESRPIVRCQLLDTAS